MTLYISAQHIINIYKKRLICGLYESWVWLSIINFGNRPIQLRWIKSHPIMDKYVRRLLIVDEITHPFSSFNSAIIEPREWISNFITQFTLLGI